MKMETVTRMRERMDCPWLETRKSDTSELHVTGPVVWEAGPHLPS